MTEPTIPEAVALRVDTSFLHPMQAARSPYRLTVGDQIVRLDQYRQALAPFDPETLAAAWSHIRDNVAGHTWPAIAQCVEIARDIERTNDAKRHREHRQATKRPATVTKDGYIRPEPDAARAWQRQAIDYATAYSASALGRQAASEGWTDQLRIYVERIAHRQAAHLWHRANQYRTHPSRKERDRFQLDQAEAAGEPCVTIPAPTLDHWQHQASAGAYQPPPARIGTWRALGSAMLGKEYQPGPTTRQRHLAAPDQPTPGTTEPAADQPAAPPAAQPIDLDDDGLDPYQA